LKLAGYEDRLKFDRALGQFSDFIDGNLVGLGQGLLELSRLGQDIDLWPLFERKSVWQMLAKKLSAHLPYHPRLGEIALAANWLRSALVPLLFIPPKTDIVHTIVNGLAALPAWTASKVHGVPLILTEHGVYLRERYLAFSEEKDSAVVKYLRTSLYQALARLVYLHADRVLSVSEFNRQWQKEFGATPSRTQVISNGVDPSLFPELPKKAQAEPTIVWIGRIDPLKDLETLIHAFRRVSRRIDNVKLKLFGPVPKGNETYFMSLVHLIESLSLDSQISFEGPVQPANLAYQQADVVALSSVSEGFPYTLIEAMMSARAVVATQVGGVEEVVGDAGLLVPAQQAEPFAEALISLLTNAKLRFDYAQRGRRRALSYFTLDKVTRAYDKVYQELMSPIALDWDDPILLLTNGLLNEEEVPILLREEEGL
jgi:glycosyltransferase involved in cell wall biosynthesis